MQKNNVLFRRYFRLIYFFIPVLIRAVSLFSKISVCSSLFYPFVLLTALLTGFAAMKESAYPAVIAALRERKLGVLPFAVALCFFAEFISCSIAFWQLLSEPFVLKTGLAIRIFTMLAALLCTVYFIMTGCCLNSSRYDLKSLKLLHVVPLLWAVGRLMEAMELSGLDSARDVSGVLKNLLLSAALLFFFCYAREIDGNESAKKITVLFSALLSYLALLYCANFVLDCFSGKLNESTEWLFLPLAFVLALFSLAFERNLMKPATEN